MSQPIHDGIGDGGVADDLMPLLNGQLAGDEGGTLTVTIVENLEEVAVLLCGLRSKLSSEDKPTADPPQD